MTKKQLIKVFEQAKDLTKKNNASIHFFMGALSAGLAYECTKKDKDIKNLHTLSNQLLEIIHEIN